MPNPIKKSNFDPTYFPPANEAKRMARELEITSPTKTKTIAVSDNLRKRHREEDLPPVLFKAPRTVVKNLTAAPSTESPAALDGSFDSDSIIQHAYMRILIFYCFAVALYRTGVRNDPDKPCEVKHEVSGSRMQVGRSNIHGFDAAHHNAASGVHDNFRKVLIEQTLNDKRLSPGKRDFLRKKEVTEPQITSLQVAAENSPETFSNLLNAFWPETLPKQSILEDTILNIVGNATTIMPALLNRKVDKGLENKIRPIMTKLYDQVAAGELTPEEACEKFCDDIQAHFAISQDILKEKKNALKYYDNTLWQLFNKIKMNSIPYSDVLSQIASLDEQKRIIQFDKGLGTPKVQIPINHDFLESCKGIVHKKNEWDRFGRISNKLKSCYESIKEEVNRKLQEVHQYAIFADLESKGSKIPPFETFIKPEEKRYIQDLLLQVKGSTVVEDRKNQQLTKADAESPPPKRRRIGLDDDNHPVENLFQPDDKSDDEEKENKMIPKRLDFLDDD